MIEAGNNMNPPSEDAVPQTTLGALSMKRTADALAVTMTFLALLWNLDFFEWLGFAFVPE